MTPGSDDLGSSPADWARLIGAVAKTQDREAFARLFQYFAPRVKSFMRRSGMSDGVAEELAQETLLMVWRKAALFDPASKEPSGWIFTIARNLRIDALRRERQNVGNQGSDVEVEFLWDEAPLADVEVAARQESARVRAAVGKLSEEQIRVIEMSFYEERVHADIAKTLQIPLGTVKSRLRLAMNKLRTLLDGVP